MNFNINATWVEIKGFPNYLISNNGSIFSKNYNKILKHKIRKNGYREIGLRNDDGCTFKLIQLLVYENFGLIWNENLQVDHIDQNKHNNCIQNLRMATGQQQQFNRGIFKNNKLGVKNITFRKNKVTPLLSNLRSRLGKRGKPLPLHNCKTIINDYWSN
jgi:hypothetical protein